MDMMRTLQMDVRQLCNRLEKVERQNRIHRTVGIFVLLMFACLLTAALSRPSRTIEAERFVLLDSQGRARITIGTPSSSGWAMDTAPEEPVIWFSDVRGNDRAMLTTEGLRLANEHSRPAASFTFTKAEGGQILLYNNDGKILFSAPK